MADKVKLYTASQLDVAQRLLDRGESLDIRSQRALAATARAGLADSERLDWLEAQTRKQERSVGFDFDADGFTVTVTDYSRAADFGEHYCGVAPTMREAIDRAIQRGPSNSEGRTPAQREDRTDV